MEYGGMDENVSFKDDTKFYLCTELPLLSNSVIINDLVIFQVQFICLFVLFAPLLLGFSFSDVISSEPDA